MLDIGKSNAKLVLLDPLSGRELAIRQKPNAPREDGPLRQLDLPGLEDWLLRMLSGLPERGRIAAILPVAHGAAAVLLDAEGEPLLAPDYEDPALSGEDAAYEALRDPFGATLSPSLPAGLNLGRQIHFVQHRLPEIFAHAAAILPYPQYWAYRLCGVAASEVTSLGCHTDLWQPAQARFSGMAIRQGWERLFPPLRSAGAVLGRLRPALAARCGLPEDCAVLCGLHDSNASYLAHLTHRAAAEPFAVVSSGTWTVLMARGTPASALRPERDMLANVDAWGGLVGTARFMGGREYRAVAGPDAPLPGEADLFHVLDEGACVLPGFAGGGVFPGRHGAVLRAGRLDGAGRSALASLYLALLTDLSLGLLHAAGELVVDGPLARDPLYPALLAALRPGSRLLRCPDSAGAVAGARCLVLGRKAPPPVPEEVSPPAWAARVRAARRRWQRALANPLANPLASPLAAGPGDTAGHIAGSALPGPLPKAPPLSLAESAAPSAPGGMI
ncbi:FGGY-family carbohydrate kinase [Roseomonas gilardii]|uniref:FGGY-family carbohydrate kinase n=1 Tax=Roseomonas gilardii TaxID=257708 RepID=UPI0011C073CB|nr:L-fuculose kinase [Roseomonas gilardii]